MVVSAVGPQVDEDLLVDAVGLDGKENRIENGEGERDIDFRAMVGDTALTNLLSSLFLLPFQVAAEVAVAEAAVDEMVVVAVAVEEVAVVDEVVAVDETVAVAVDEVVAAAVE